MKAKRQRHQSAFKAKVGLEALLGIKTVAEIAREYRVHPTQRNFQKLWMAGVEGHPKGKFV